MIQQNGKTLLEVRGLCASVNGIDILKGIDLTVRSGEVHALMGPNGSGKSTFAKALAGHPSYVVTGGTVFYEGKNLLELKGGAIQRVVRLVGNYGEVYDRYFGPRQKTAVTRAGTRNDLAKRGGAMTSRPFRN